MLVHSKNTKSKRKKIMKYTYEINSDNQTIVVLTIGNLIKHEVVEMGIEILLKAKELKYRVIFDHRLSKNRISFSEAYNWYLVNYDIIDYELKRIPTAYIINIEDWDFYSFFECTCYNKGIPVKVFKDENAVSEWLKGF